MRTVLDWSVNEDVGMGDAYADIPRHGGDFAKAVAVCIGRRQCETRGKEVMRPSYRVTGNPSLSTGGRVRLPKTALNAELAEEALLLSLRAAPDAELVANGFSRRQQNRAHAGRRARHLASVLRDGLASQKIGE